MSPGPCPVCGEPCAARQNGRGYHASFLQTCGAPECVVELRSFNRELAIEAGKTRPRPEAPPIAPLSVFSMPSLRHFRALAAGIIEAQLRELIEHRAALARFAPGTKYGKKRRRALAEIDAWLRSRDGSFSSFGGLCELLGWDPDRVEAKLRERLRDPSWRLFGRDERDPEPQLGGWRDDEREHGISAHLASALSAFHKQGRYVEDAVIWRGFHPSGPVRELKDFSRDEVAALCRKLQAGVEPCTLWL